jgi:hypothetical protein
LIDRERLDSVRKKYGHYAGWAVWSAEGLTPKSGIGDISFFEDPREELLAILNPEVILVALNISRPIQRPFGNFHPDYPAAQDYKLRHALYETGFWGGYLTDIIKDFEEKASGKMMTYLRQNPDFERANMKIFREEIAAIGSVSPTLIALGVHSFALLKRNLGGDFRILEAPHYSMYVSRETYRSRFPKDEALRTSGFSAI